MGRGEGGGDGRGDSGCAGWGDGGMHTGLALAAVAVAMVAGSSSAVMVAA